MRYLILSSPRTGSTMLATALEETGVAGRPHEIFLRTILAEQGNPQADPIRLQRYFAQCVERDSTPNGVFGMKLHMSQFDLVFSDKNTGVQQGLAFLKQFHKFVLIYRRDKVLQAISELLASENKQWESRDPSAAGRVGRSPKKTDVPKICRIMSRQIEEEFAWRTLMERQGLPYHDVAYEDLVANLKNTLVGLLKHLAVDPQVGWIPRTKTVKLTNESSTLELKQHFLAAISGHKT